jgi:hypothetical protein
MLTELLENMAELGVGDSPSALERIPVGNRDASKFWDGLNNNNIDEWDDSECPDLVPAPGQHPETDLLDVKLQVVLAIMAHCIPGKRLQARFIYNATLGVYDGADIDATAMKASKQCLPCEGGLSQLALAVASAAETSSMQAGPGLMKFARILAGLGDAYYTAPSFGAELEKAEERVVRAIVEKFGEEEKRKVMEREQEKKRDDEKRKEQQEYEVVEVVGGQEVKRSGLGASRWAD